MRRTLDSVLACKRKSDPKSYSKVLDLMALVDFEEEKYPNQIEGNIARFIAWIKIITFLFS